MIKITFTDLIGVCWEFFVTNDMNVVEILECLNQQFDIRREKI